MDWRNLLVALTLLCVASQTLVTASTTQSSDITTTDQTEVTGSEGTTQTSDDTTTVAGTEGTGSTAGGTGTTDSGTGTTDGGTGTTDGGTGTTDGGTGTTVGGTGTTDGGTGTTDGGTGMTDGGTGTSAATTEVSDGVTEVSDGATESSVAVTGVTTSVTEATTESTDTATGGETGAAETGVTQGSTGEETGATEGQGSEGTQASAGADATTVAGTGGETGAAAGETGATEGASEGTEAPSAAGGDTATPGGDTATSAGDTSGTQETPGEGATDTSATETPGGDTEATQTPGGQPGTTKADTGATEEQKDEPTTVATPKKPTYSVYYNVTTIPVKPYCFISDSDDSGYQGYVIDLLNKMEILLKAGFNIQTVKDSKFGKKLAEGKWTGMIGEVMRGEVDMAAAPLTVTTDRDAVVDFTLPIMSISASAVIMKRHPLRRPQIHSLDDMLDNEFTFSCLENSNIHKSLQQSKSETDQNVLEIIEKEGFKETNDDGIADARFNSKYAFLMESSAADYAVSLDPCILEAIPTNIYKRKYAFAVPNQSPLRDIFNAALTELQNLDEIDELREKWFRGEKCSGSFITSSLFNVSLLVVIAHYLLKY